MADTCDETNQGKLVGAIVTESGKQPFGSMIYCFIQFMSELEKIAAINDCNDGRLDWKNDTLADEITASWGPSP